MVENIIPFALQAILHDPELRIDVLTAAPSAAALADVVIRDGPLDSSGVVTWDFRSLVKELNKNIPALLEAAEENGWPVEQLGTAYRAETNERHAARVADREPAAKGGIIRSFAGAVMKETRAAANRVPPVPDATRRVRLEICMACPRIDRSATDERLSRCTACGCFVYLKTKWRTQRCPLEKW